MSQTTLANHLEIINDSLKRRKEIFDIDLTQYCPNVKMRERADPELSGYKLVTVYWPFPTGKFDSRGLLLRDNMGTISIEVTYRFKSGNKRSYVEVEHSYRYFNQDHKYTFEHSTISEPMIMNHYSFRYDKDLRDSASNDPEEHMQVIDHQVPRFKFENLTIEHFLETVKETCFLLNKNRTIISARAREFFAQ